jgi:hypothetical protein
MDGLPEHGAVISLCQTNAYTEAPAKVINSLMDPIISWSASSAYYMYPIVIPMKLRKAVNADVLSVGAPTFQLPSNLSLEWYLTRFFITRVVIFVLPSAFYRGQFPLVA